MVLPAWLKDRLRLPLIAAPMTGVSSPRLVIEACANGVIGAFPTHNCRLPGELDEWLDLIERELEVRSHAASSTVAPFAANLIVHRAYRRLDEDLACLFRHHVELVITSVGSPIPVLGRLHGMGCKVFADVASLHHAAAAIEAGVDGLVLLSSGAGGQTGWINPFAFIRAVRPTFKGPIVLAGGVSDGSVLLAAQVAGYDLVYMGTKFIATEESSADSDYRNAIVESSVDDLMLTNAITGLPVNVLATSMSSSRDTEADGGVSTSSYTDSHVGQDVWSAGHSISGVDRVLSVYELVERTAAEYRDAQERAQSLLASASRVSRGDQ